MCGCSDRLERRFRKTGLVVLETIVVILVKYLCVIESKAACREALFPARLASSLSFQQPF
jgi:hypothetical protein